MVVAPETHRVHPNAFLSLNIDCYCICISKQVLRVCLNYSTNNNQLEIICVSYNFYVIAFDIFSYIFRLKKLYLFQVHSPRFDGVYLKQFVQNSQHFAQIASNIL